MKLTIFSRLVIGYTIILTMVVVASIYSMYQLINVNMVTRSVLETDNHMLDLQKKLTDSLFEQIRYEKKAIVMRDVSLYDHFLTAKVDFNKYLREAHSIADSPETKNLLTQAETVHRRYQSSVAEEMEKLKTDRTYDFESFAQTKEDRANQTITALKNLEEYSRNNTFNKIKQLDSAVTNSRSVSLAIIMTTLLLGIVISVVITGTIVKPLSVMKKRTQDIAKGNFSSPLRVSSPPEIKELADSFNSMCDQLKEVDTMKSDFLSIMSHELRTPLTSIKEGTNLLLEGVGGDITIKQKRLLNIIAEEDKRLITQVNSLLDLSKMEAGMMTYVFTEGNIVPLIRKAVVEIEPLAQSKVIRFEEKLSPQIRVAKMDAERISQLLRNLLSNAVKFTPKGGMITISSQESNGWAHVSITDTGPGVPAKELDRIFDKYRQARNPDANQKRGTGLGLAIVKHIVMAHGGKVWVESKLGRGSTFTFALPV